MKARRRHESPASYRALAEQFDVSTATIHHWKHEPNSQDGSCRPQTIAYALDEHEEEWVLWLRRTGELPLDELVDEVQKLLPHARRSSVHRLLVRKGCSRLPSKKQQATGHEGEGVATFKDYGPGFLHIDCFYLPKFDGQKRYCFVASPKGHPTAPRAWCFFTSTKPKTRRRPPTF